MIDKKRLPRPGLKKGCKVKITRGPIDKVGRIGEVTMLFSNGAMVKLSEDWFTPIKLEHLEVINEKAS